MLTTLFSGNPLVERLFVEEKREKNRYRLYQLLDSQITYFKKKMADSEIDLIASM
jgi:hypothetical protein